MEYKDSFEEMDIEAVIQGKDQIPSFVFLKMVKELQDKMDGMEAQLQSLVNYLEPKANITDCRGTQLVVGDLLGGGSLQAKTKKVLALGFKKAELSRVGEHETSDGWWYEEQMKKRGWVVVGSQDKNKK